MSALDDLERLFQTRCAYDDALMFRIRSRRARLAGLWAGELMGLSTEAAERYADDLVQGGTTGPGGSDLCRRIVADLRAAGVELSEHRVEKRLHRLLDEARTSVMVG